MVMRAQLARAEAVWFHSDLYNQIFTMRGTARMFLFAVPVMEAFGVFLVPLMLGTRSIAFPRLSAFSYLVCLFGGLMIWFTFALNVGADTGRFSCVPLAGPEYGLGKRVVFWAQMIPLTEVAALAVSVENIVTTLKQRAHGMTLDRSQFFVRAQIVTAFAAAFAMPAVMIASSMLIMDRLNTPADLIAWIVDPPAPTRRPPCLGRGSPHRGARCRFSIRSGEASAP